MGENEILDNIREYKELQMLIRGAEDELGTTKAKIIAEMEARGVDTLCVDIFTVKHTPCAVTRFDATRFKHEHTELYETYSETTSHRRFSIQ